MRARSVTTIAVLVAALSAVSCATAPPPSTLPPPGPPQPAPPIAESPPPARAQEARPPASKPSPGQGHLYLVAVQRLGAGGRHDLAPEETAMVLNLLNQNGLSAQAVQVPEALPDNIREAAFQAAAAQPRNAPGEIFILGQVIPGPTLQVRMAAVDLRTGRVIDDFGFQGPPQKAEGVVRRTLDGILGAVDAHWSGAGRTLPR